MPRRLHGFLQPELVGEDTTERTTTSTSTADLSTITMPSVAVTRWIIVRGAYRKSAGAAASVSLGLKVNATAVIADTAVTGGAADEIEEGVFELVVPPQQTGYLEAAVGTAQSSDTNASGQQSLLYAGTPAPAATVTSIVVTGLTGNASVTCAVKNVQAFVY